MDEQTAASLAAPTADSGAPTIFDKSITKAIPSTVVYEDDKVLAFKDINPQAPAHIVLIPKKRDGLTQANEDHKDILGHLLYTAKVVAKQEGLADEFRVVINDGPNGCQSVYHLHLHIIGVRKLKWPPGTKAGSQKVWRREAMEERMNVAVIEACRALRRRHKLEEGAHGPAITALSRVAKSQGAELQVKVENLQQELAQSYRAHAQAREQLVTELTSGQTFRSQLEKKEAIITEFQDELLKLRSRVKELEDSLELQGKALDVAEHERTSLKLKVQELETMLSKAETDNKMLVDRWMEQKMQDAERLNEANAMYEDMMERLKSSRLEELARQQVDGIVRHSEAGAELYVGSGPPSQVRFTLQAHEGGGSAIAFEHNSGVLFTGGHDRVLRQWETTGGTSLATHRGCLGSVLDLTLAVDNRQVLAACSDHKLYLWDTSSGRLRHTLTGHTEKVVGVDVSQVGSKKAVSASHDRTMKLWDLGSGYGLNTIVCFSNCNALCLTADGSLICSGHMDGNLRFWDYRTGRLANELAAHGQGITSVSLSRSGNTILTSGRDNVHNIFDVRTLEIRDTCRSSNFRAATNWTRSCLSPDENFVAAGSADGTVVLWNMMKTKESEIVLKGGHLSSVIACAWSGVGKPLASADKSGRVCIWE